jgi:hypothetical protein
MSNAGRENIAQAIQTVEKRRPHRDLAYLHTPNVSVATLLVNNWKNWIITETRDLLEIIEILERSDNPAVPTIVEPFEQRLTEIQEKCGKILSPMNMISRGRSGARNEAERFQKLRFAIEGVESIILELQTIRRILEAIVNTLIGSSYPPDGSSSYVR